ncbi:unnamed protein product [Protopolystoma xenopodis]|uniref:Uncharacterized protein n=1 Tax=Protopolystoma xenopodis TaxID=117903 RepID=A0A448XJW4_9PLAT|nr:unnamed protein product [Protopolystoma xenopodis]
MSLVSFISIQFAICGPCIHSVRRLLIGWIHSHSSLYRSSPSYFEISFRHGRFRPGSPKVTFVFRQCPVLRHLTRFGSPFPLHQSSGQTKRPRLFSLPSNMPKA